MSINTIRNTVLLPLILGIASCTNSGSFLATSGPTRSSIQKISEQPETNIAILPLSGAIVAQLGSYLPSERFSDVFQSSAKIPGSIGLGDLVEVRIWETPPAVLFSSGNIQSASSGKEFTLPEQMVDNVGNISVPFVGNIRVKGKIPSQVEREIVSKLKGRANKPQVFVRIVKNNNATVTVVGSSGNNRLIPISSKNERLLEVITLAGGINDSLNRISIQLTRQDQVVSMPLESIIKDPQQNIHLNSGDVITIQNQPSNFTVLGASGKNEEIGFEAKGISLAQALGRSGGLQDFRADASGVFIFRFEEPSRLVNFTSFASDPNNLVEGKLPVIYQIDLKNPQTFFWSQKFMIQNNDMIYVSNASSADLNKFLSIITSSIYSVSAVKGL